MALIRKYKKKKKLGNYPYTSVVFSITLALFVIGLFGMLVLHANKLKDLIKENVEVQVYLNKFTTENGKIKINKTLSAKDYAYYKDGQAQIQFISKEDAVKQFTSRTGEDPLDFLGENPLLDAFILKIKPEFQDADNLKRIKAEIESMNGVFEVSYLESLVTAINENLKRIGIVLIAFSIILLITVAMLISNTIKLALFSQRFLIRSMQLVGARAGFIQRPFLIRSIFHGLLGGILAAGLLALLLQYAYQNVQDLSLLRDDEKLMILFGSLTILGAMIGLISTFRAMKKYLKMSLDDLY